MKQFDYLLFPMPGPDKYWIYKEFQRKVFTKTARCDDWGITNFNDMTHVYLYLNANYGPALRVDEKWLKLRDIKP